VRNAYRFSLENLKGIDHSENLDVDGKITFALGLGNRFGKGVNCMRLA
jgi:hypothetical protein